eukprot:scaffold1480_cov52-Attheya_sp.AAC.4
MMRSTSVALRWIVALLLVLRELLNDVGSLFGGQVNAISFEFKFHEAGKALFFGRQLVPDGGWVGPEYKRESAVEVGVGIEVRYVLTHLIKRIGRRFSPFGRDVYGSTKLGRINDTTDRVGNIIQRV